MSVADAWTIFWVAGAAAMVVGALGLAVAWWVRRASLVWQSLVIAAVASLGAYAGVTAIAQLMLISAHDLTVITVVSAVSAVIAVAIAVVVGSAMVRWSSALGDQVRSLGPGKSSRPTDTGPREIRQLSRELAEAQERLEQARLRELRLEESRRELVSWVSHDLRTPLAGMRAMAEALEDGIAPEPERFHQQIRIEVDRMTRMVDDLFEVSRIHAGVLRLSPEPVALTDLVSEALAGAEPVAKSRRVVLGGQVEPGLEVVADPAGLSRVVSNLLMNAIRHTPAEGAVSINGRRVDDGVELCVTDACGGLDPEEMDRVFDVGWQGSAARTRDGLDRGAGLGLAIVRGIVEAHHGSVQVDNHEAVDGCRFSITLPATSAPAQQDGQSSQVVSPQR